MQGAGRGTGRHPALCREAPCRLAATAVEEQTFCSVGLVHFASLSEGIRGLWAFLGTVQAHREKRVSPQTAAVALGFKIGCPGAQALPACTAWVVERAGAKGNVHRGQCLIPGLRQAQMPLGLSRGHRAAPGGCRQLAGACTGGGEGPLEVRSAWTGSHHPSWSCMPRNYRWRRRQLLRRMGLWGGLARSSVTALPGLTQL